MRLGASAELGELRADRRRNVQEVYRILARYASWADRTTRPTRQRICELAHVSVSTFKAARRWLEQHGWLGTVRRGWTPLRLLRAVLDAGKPNEAAIWVLCVPRDKPRTPLPIQSETKTRPLTGSRSEPAKAPARETRQDHGSELPEPVRIVMHLRRQVAELRRGPGQTLGERGVLAISRPFLAARWSPADLAFAINHDPSRGRHRVKLSGIRSPHHWLAWRLSRWTVNPDAAYEAYRRLGHWDYAAWPVPVESPAARRLAEAEAIAAETARRRGELAAAAANRVDPGPHAAAIRQQLGWTRQPRHREAAT